MRSADGAPNATRASMARARAIVAAAMVCGLALRLAFAFGYWVDKPLTLDEQEYLLLATSLARGEGLTYPASPATVATRHFERPPLFAVFLAGVLRLTGDPLITSGNDASGAPKGFPRSSSQVPASIKGAQSAVGLMVVLLVAALAYAAGGVAAAAAGGSIAALYPSLVCSSGYVLSEPLYSLLALSVAWLLDRTGRSSGDSARRIAWVFAAGLLAGLAVLTKEAMVFFLPFAGLWLLVRRGFAPALALTLGVLVVLTPWIARNHAVYGRFVLTAPHGGVTFWTGNNPVAVGEGDLAANPGIGRARVEFERRHAGETTEAIDNAYYREAFRFIADHPAAWATLVVKKLFYTFAPVGPSYRLHSRRYYAATAGCYILLFPFAMLGLVTLVRRRRAADVAALWLLVTSSVVMCLVFFPQERFRIPVLDPALIVCAAVWFGSLAGVSRLFGPPPALQRLV